MAEAYYEKCHFYLFSLKKLVLLPPEFKEAGVSSMVCLVSLFDMFCAYSLFFPLVFSAPELYHPHSGAPEAQHGVQACARSERQDSAAREGLFHVPWQNSIWMPCGKKGFRIR